VSPARKARAPSPRSPRRGSIVVVGAGRLGGALALTLQRAGWSVTVQVRSAQARRHARRLGLRLADAQALEAAAVCLLCVPDGAVGEVAQALAPQLGARTALVHCAGALRLEALGEQGQRPVGSFHPLCAVSDARDSLAGHAVALSTAPAW
jgi:prephenate dehydrogenase